jgi:hypothetical protein
MAAKFIRHYATLSVGYVHPWDESHGYLHSLALRGMEFGHFGRGVDVPVRPFVGNFVETELGSMFRICWERAKTKS